MIAFLQNAMTAAAMSWVRHTHWRRLIEASFEPRRAQAMALQKILHDNHDTVFGREHNFSLIREISDYQRAVSVNNYEDLRDSIERQDREKTACLTREQPVMFAQTSGTTGAPKYVPILPSTISQYRRGQQMVAYAIRSRIAGAFRGKILAITSPACEGRLASGTPYGSMSGLIYQSMPGLLQRRYVVPARAFAIEDYNEKYREIARCALAEENISMIATANPSTLLKLADIIDRHAQELIEEIAATHPRRAKLLLAILSGRGRLEFSALWPRLEVLSTWTGGSCGALLPRLRAQLPATTRIVELGYLCSEFRGSINVDVLNDRQIPPLNDTFFEFVELNDRESENPAFLAIDQLQEGRRYYVFATTQCGLYRYDVNDIIEVTGMFNNTPTIRFVQKGRGVVNLTGEKLYESQLLQAVHDLFARTPGDAQFFIMLGCAQTVQYTLFIEGGPINPLSVEGALCALNVEYAAKLESGRLRPLRVKFLRPDTGELYKQHCLAAGQREGQFKFSCLQYLADCDFDFFAHTQN